jgi:hypothetical protein
VVDRCSPVCKVDADCQGKGVCDTELAVDGFGFCVQAKGQGENAVSGCGGSGGAGGAGGAGGGAGSGGAAPIEVQCTGVPANAPSSGSCIMVNPNGANKCNPVTNAGCNANQACDFNEAGNGFECYGATAPDNKTCGQACGQEVGFCAGKNVCAFGECARFCCTNADCGPSGTCDASVIDNGTTLGICVAKLASPG